MIEGQKPPERKETKKEQFEFAVVRYHDEIFKGKKHEEALRQMQKYIEDRDPAFLQETGGDYDTFFKIVKSSDGRKRFRHTSGFLTTEGRFLNREKAIPKAREFGQLKNTYKPGDPLSSDDVNFYNADKD